MKNSKNLKKNTMEDEEKFIIGKKILKRSDFFKEEETRKRKAATLSFEKKIKILIDLQKLAYKWGRKNIIIWKI
ncbi:MAG: hypothetical protein B6D56_02505 [Candidatus Omnitrophica bacterium 4484_70.1]|nr:MAG: hypothetical protein B6D56_02505 [Candidatus Omnitrophica bacterium 4484_70.1]